MHCTILTPDREVFNGPITSVKVPGTLGEFQILKNHAAIVSALVKGSITVVTASGEYRVYDDVSGQIETNDKANETISFNIEQGFVEVLNNEISILAGSVDALAAD